ncbi:hypothetical protein HDU79_012005 [Rhizoclosmatium sp. JEL0117]|nr:hypothetical protein HDU79_012005 [Rhizoclosmatium sp. JEL0117]
MNSSKSVAILRLRIATELRARLHAANKLGPHALSLMPKQDRDAIFRAVSDAVLSEGPLIPGDEESGVNGRTLWMDIREEAEASVDEQLGVAIAAGLFKERGGSGADTLEAKMKLAMKESEMGIMNLLSKWPDSRIALRGCVNVALSRDLRRVAWLACLSDNDTVKDFFHYVNTDRIQKNTVIYGTSFFHICQSFLGSFPLLLQLASQYRVVKRMEQVLGYLLTEKSVPHLRSMHLAIEAFPPDELTERLNTTRAHPKLSEFQSLGEGSVRRRQMMLLVPFLKALELDDIDITNTNMLGERQTKYLDEDGEFTRIVARAAEGESRDWLNVFYANDDVNLRKKGGYNMDWDESRTARLTEVYARFWSIIPFSWREGGDLMVQAISADVEAYLHKEDPELYSFLANMLGKPGSGHDFSGFRKYIRQLLGDVFVGRCSLTVLCYIFDQFIVASFESTGDEKFPSMDSLCAWICGSMMIQMKDKLMKCTSADELGPVSAIYQSAMTVSVLSTTMEVHFLSKFRASLLNTFPIPPPFVDLPNHVFGYNATAMSLLPAERKNAEMYEKVVAYLANVKRLEDEKKDIGKRGTDLDPLSEKDLIFAETEEYALLKEFYIEKRRKERRLKQLMRMDEEFKRRQAEQDEIGTSFLHRMVNNADEEGSIYGVWGNEDGRLNDDDDVHMHSNDSFGLNNDPLFAEELRRQEAIRAAEAAAAADAEYKRQQAKSQVKKPPLVKNTLVVRMATFVGEECINLTVLGQIFAAIFKKVQYLLQGEFCMNLAMIDLVGHALSFESLLEKDLEQVLKKQVPKGEFYSVLRAISEKNRHKVLELLERARIKRLEHALAASGSKAAAADEGQIMRVEEDESIKDSIRDMAMELVAGKVYTRKIKDMKRFTGLFSNIVEGLRIVVEGDQDLRETNWVASLHRENEFHQAEKAAWNTLFGEKPEYSEARVKTLVSGNDPKKEAFLREVEKLLK